MNLSNKVYDNLKWVCMVVVPACVSCYTVIANACGIPYTATVITVAEALNTCLGVCLGISTNKYNINILKENMEDV